MEKRSWLDLADILNALRAIPRALLTVYGAMGVWLAVWYTQLPAVERTAETSGFVGLVLAAFAKLCDWYMKTGGKNSE